MRKILTLLIALTTVTALFADPKEYPFSGRVVNSFTQEPIPNVNVTLMRPDSTVVGTTQTFKTNYNGSPAAFFSFKLSRQEQGKFIVRFTHLNYDTFYANIEVNLSKRSLSYSMDPVLLNRRKDRALKEVAVTATKVKMIVRGDTVIYNADAFQLAEGSMLDALIKQLPGAELKSDGRIYVNGRFVSSLQLNGKDFFKGNNRVLLDNLPSYMVNKVKVYEQESEMGRFEGKTSMPKLYVMDVNLKKEYSVGWIANVRAGYGSNDRFLGRLFGLRFTPNSRLTLFGSSNNINDTRRPGEDGEWKPTDAIGGQKTSNIGGFDYLLDDKYRFYKFSNSTQLEHQNTDTRFHSSGETFLPSGNVFSRLQQLIESKDLKLTTQNSLRLTWKKVYWSSNLAFDYTKKSNDVFSRSAVLSVAPPEGYNIPRTIDSIFFSSDSRWLNHIINRTLTNLKGDVHTSNGKFSSWLTVSPWKGIPDNISLSVDASYSTTDNNTYDHYGVDYLSEIPALSDFRNRYTNTPERKYNFSSKLNYTYWLPNGLCLMPTYKYAQSYRSSDRSLYRLDLLNDWGVGSSRSLGALPSTQDSLQVALDWQNSFYSTHRQYIHEVSMDVNGETDFDGGRLSVQAYFPIHFEKNTLDYRRNILDTILTKPLVSFAPKVSLQANRWGDGNSRSINLDFSSIVAIPTMSYLLNVRDDANPLYVSLGNPDLKNTTTHSLSFGYSTSKTEYTQSFNFNYNLNIIQNAVALGFLYDKQSGVRTTTPQNVNGNWYSNVEVGFSRAIDKQGIWSFSTKTYAGYNRNVDLTGLAGDSQVQRSVVDNFNGKEDVSLRYQYKWLQVSAKFGINAAHLTSERNDFNTIDYRDYNYGLNAIATLPWKMQLSTDLIQYSRRGYEDRLMNTDDMVWNLRLSKSVMHGNLTFMADAFDVLGNLSNINRSINAQGRSEYYYNVIQRYVLFHAIYRLNIKPKKQSN